MEVPDLACKVNTHTHNTNTHLLENIHHLLVIGVVAVDAHQDEPTAHGVLVALETPPPQGRVLAPPDDGGHGLGRERVVAVAAVIITNSPYGGRSAVRALPLDVDVVVLLVPARLRPGLAPGGAAAVVGEAAQLGEADGQAEVDGGGPARVDGRGVEEGQEEEAAEEVEELAGQGGVGVGILVVEGHFFPFPSLSLFLFCLFVLGSQLRVSTSRKGQTHILLTLGFHECHVMLLFFPLFACSLREWASSFSPPSSSHGQKIDFSSWGTRGRGWHLCVCRYPIYPGPGGDERDGGGGKTNKQISTSFCVAVKF